MNATCNHTRAAVEPQQAPLACRVQVFSDKAELPPIASRNRVKSVLLRAVTTTGVAFTVVSANAEVAMRPLQPVPGVPQVAKQYIEIHGPITAADPQAFLAQLPKWRGAIGLNSPGGDLQAAMELGRMLRKHERDAIVDVDDVCASACVLILAGAPFRMVLGKVGIHRPYLPNDTVTDPMQQKRRYHALEKEIKAYLEEMNINPSLYDDMIRISPGSVRYLSKADLERYGLSGSDPYIDEASLTTSANMLRITKEELLKRRARKRSECKSKDPEQYGKCAVAIEYGISIAEYEKRESRAQIDCAGESNRPAWVQCHTRVTRGF